MSEATDIAARAQQLLDWGSSQPCSRSMSSTSSAPMAHSEVLKLVQRLANHTGSLTVTLGGKTSGPTT